MASAARWCARCGSFAAAPATVARLVASPLGARSGAVRAVASRPAPLAQVWTTACQGQGPTTDQAVRAGHVMDGHAGGQQTATVAARCERQAKQRTRSTARLGAPSAVSTDLDSASRIAAAAASRRASGSVRRARTSGLCSSSRSSRPVDWLPLRLPQQEILAGESDSGHRRRLERFGVGRSNCPQRALATVVSLRLLILRPPSSVSAAPGRPRGRSPAIGRHRAFLLNGRSSRDREAEGGDPSRLS